MANEWTARELSELASDVSYGYTESASAEKVGPRFLRITDIQNGIVNWPNVPYCPITRENHKKYRLHEGDIVIARTGNSTGENFLYQGGEDAVFASYLIRFQIDQKKADPKFVWYNLRSHAWWDFVNKSKTGSAQAGANAKILGRFLISYPPLPEQRAIAHILGTLDDKIELNRKQNETLEEMARALFKAWFVDFEPVRAKMEGRWQRGKSLPGLPAHLFDLFPDRLIESELGAIPEGWEVKTVGDIGKIICGKTPPTAVLEYHGDDVPFITIPEMHGKIFATDVKKRLSYKGADSQQKKILPPKTICVSCIATLGLVTITTELSQTNQQINSVIPSDDRTTYYWYWVLRDLGQEIKAEGSGGSVLGNLSTRRFSALRVYASSEKLRLAYNSNVESMFAEILANERESRSLAQLRDTLLPKLISGELRVPDAENFANEATQ